MNKSHYGPRKKLLRAAAELKTFGQRVRFHRITAGLTQQDLAGKGGWSKSFVSLMESNRTSPSVPTVQQLAEIFDITLDWLVAGKNIPTQVRRAVGALEKQNHGQARR